MAEQLKILDEINAKIRTSKKELDLVKTAVVEISKQMREASGAFTFQVPKDAAQRVDANNKSVSALNKKLAEQEALNKKLTTQYNQRARAQKRSNQATIEERVNQSILQRNAKEYARINSNLTTSYEKQSQKLIKLRREYKNLAVKQEIGIKLTKAEIREKDRLLKQANKLDVMLKRVDKSVGQSQRNVGNYSSALRGLAGSFRSLATAFGITSGLFIFAGVVRSAIGVFKQFDQAQADLAAILGKTRGEITKLTDQAKELGATTAFTATQISELQLELSKLGFSEDQILAATRGVENLAIATGVDAARAAKLAGASLRGFNLEAEEANRVSAALAVSTTKSASSFETLEVALPKVSSIANSFGFTIEDTAALLGSLQNAGFEASIAGTSLRQIFLQLADENGALAKRLGGTAGNLDELVKQFKKLEKEGISLSEAFNLTNARSVAAFQVFLKGADDITALRDSITGVEDELTALADEKLNSVQGELTLLNSAWEGWILSLDESNEAANDIKDIISALSKNLNQILNTIVNVAQAFLLYKGILIATSLATRAYVGVVGALRLAKIALAGGIGKATKAMKLFNVATKSNPVGAVLSVLAAGIATVVAFRDGVNESAEAMRKLKEAADKAKDSIVEADLALIDSRLANIDQEVSDTAQATEAKIALLNEEIEKRKNGTAGMYDSMEDIQKASLDKQSQASANFYDNLEEQESKYTNGLPKDARIPSSVPGVPPRFSTANPDQLAANNEVQKELERRRRALLKSLADITKKQEEQDAKDAEKRRKQRLKDRFAYNSFVLQTEIEFLNNLASNENESSKDRLAAAEVAAMLENELAEKQAAYGLELINSLSKEEIKQVVETGRLTLEQRQKVGDKELLILAKLNSERLNIQRKNSDEELSIRIDQIKKQGENEAKIREVALNQALENENNLFLQTLDQYNSYEDALRAHEQRKIDIKRRFARETLEIQLSTLESLLQSEELTASQRLEYEKQISDLRLKLSELTTDQVKEDNEEIADSLRDNLQELIGAISDAASSISSLFETISSNRMQRIDEQIAAEEARYDAILENEQISDEQREQIEAERDQRKKKLEQKRREEEKRAFIARQIFAVAEIKINLARQIAAINATSETLGPGLSQAYKATFIPLAIATSGIQVAAVLAQRAPAFKDGVENFAGGLAIVGDGGKQEPITDSSGQLIGLSPSTPTLVNLPKGSNVYSSVADPGFINHVIGMDLSNGSRSLNQAAQAQSVGIEQAIKNMLSKVQNPVIHNHQKGIDYSRLAKELSKINKLESI